MLLLLAHCAQPIPPQGGPRDMIPPELVPEKSTPNFLTEFKKQDIIITFNEWVNLKDQFKQIVISPPLANRPEIKVKGKSVEVIFDEREELTPNTTYTINFGSSIQDLTENNPINNFKYVFSTGTFIDSLEIRGQVYQAATGEPATESIVILHPLEIDSAIYRDRPAYFTRTDSSGNFTLDYIRSDSFSLYVLKDNNLNYIFDQEEEQIGFYSDPVILPDTDLGRIQVAISQQRPELRIFDRELDHPGAYKVAFNREPVQLQIDFLRGAEDVHWVQEKDTLRLWCSGRDTVIFAPAEGNLPALDTLRFPCFNGESPVKSLVMKSADKSILPSGELKLVFNAPVSEADTSHMIIRLADTIAINPASLRFSVDTSDKRVLKIGGRWSEKGNYSMKLAPGFAVGSFDQTHDTLRLKYQITDPELMSNLLVKITGLDSTRQYIFQFVQDKQVLESRIFADAKEYNINLPSLRPKASTIVIVEDRNRNGVWDSVNLKDKLQPEPIMRVPLQTLKPSWDVEFPIQWLN